MSRRVAEALHVLGGTARLHELTGLTTRAAVRSAVRTGTVVRLSHGVYALPDIRDDLQLAASLRGRLSHASAAAHWLLEPLSPPEAVHVTVPRRSAGVIAPKRVRLHYADLTGDGRVTDPLRTVLDCARTMPFPEALAIADSACRRELVPADELTAAAEALGGAGRQRILRVARLADARAANPFESALRAVVIEAGLTGFRPQLRIEGPPNRFVDLGDAELRIAVEADSYSHHGTRQAFAADCRRYDELAVMGWLVLRFAWEHVMFHRDWVAEVLLSAVSMRQKRGHKGRRGKSQPTSGKVLPRDVAR